MRRRLLIGALVAAVITVAGVAYAASSSSPGTGRQAFLNDLAGRLHVTPQQLRAAIQGARDDQIDALVKAGRLTSAQAAKIKRRLAQAGGPGFGPAFAPPLPQGLRRPGPGPRFAPGLGLLLAPGQVRPAPGAAPPLALARPGFAHPRFLPGLALAPLGELRAVARYLGLSDRALLAKLGAGASPAAIAQQRGRTQAGLKAAIRAAVAARLSRLVRAGWLPAAQRQRILQALSAKLDAAVRRSWALRHP